MSALVAFVIGVIVGITLTIVFILFVLGAAYLDEQNKPPSKDDWRGLD